MEPTTKQFSNIYRKGEDQTGLATRAVEQRIERESERRDIGDTAQGVRDYNTGITTARHIVDMGNSVPLRDYTKTELGPVSGTEIANAKDRKRQTKKKR
jgi:hypothetical protein